MRYVIGVVPGALALVQWTAIASAQLAAPPVTPPRLPAAAKAAPAQPEIAADIHEEIAHVEATVRLLDGTTHTGNLVVTHFRPNGPGPFPVVVFNHGRTPATRNEPVRWRMPVLARYWVRRGFAVMVPTRIGYGETGKTVDPEASGACATADFRPALDNMTAQITRTVEFARSLPWIDAKRVILAGASYGGFATVAATARPIPGVVGAVNFVGGLGGNPQQRPGSPCQAQRVAGIAAELGAKSRVPILWLYAENDTYWGKEWPRRWFDAFTGAGGRAQLASFPAVGDEGHKLMSGGFSLWRPVVDKFVSSLGFPLPAAAPKLAASGFADINDAAKVPHVKPSVRTEAYAKFLAADVPRAFALAPSGAWAWRSGLDATEVALARCQKNAATTCSLYAVDDRVVWKVRDR